MTCLAERAGYEKYQDAVDMAVSLDGSDLDTGPAEERLAAAGTEVRRATAAETGPIVDWLRQGPCGSSGWRVERVYWLYRKALLPTCQLLPARSTAACSPVSTAPSLPAGSATGWTAAWRACCCSRATSPARTSSDPSPRSCGSTTRMS